MAEQITKRPRAAGKTRLQGRLQGRRPSAPQGPRALKLLITIVGRSKAEFFVDLLQSQEINIQMVLTGEGTAPNDMRQLLGLTDNAKAVILGVVREDRAKDALSLLEEKFHTVRGARGIAYTIPLTSVVGVAIYRFLSNNRTPTREDSRTDGKTAARSAAGKEN